MNLQEKMFLEVENWVNSGTTKLNFLEGKEYSEAKFNYWLAKWKAMQLLDSNAGFREVDFSEVTLGKVLEIESPSGVKITVFA
jgi:hypothetical protein